MKEGKSQGGIVRRENSKQKPNRAVKSKEHPAGEMGTYQPKVGAFKILFKTQIKYQSSLHLSILKLLLPLPFYIPKGTLYSRTRGQSSKREC